ncbi:18901_t:CDS:2, partial [Dentiscutata erythropus]
MSKDRVHEYFNRKSSEWSVVNFLEEIDGVGLFNDRIGYYLASLEKLMDMDDGERNRTLARNWEKERNYAASGETSYGNSQNNGTIASNSAGVTNTKRKKASSESSILTNKKGKTASLSRSLRKRESKNYAESSVEDTNSTDSNYSEKSEKQKEPKLQPCSEGMLSSEPSEDENTPILAQQLTMPSNISEDAIFCEVSFQKSPTTENIDNSREYTPCPVTQQSIQQALIFAPNKPIVSKLMYDRYSPYLICAFNATINYVKETVDERIYMEIKNLLQLKDRLILQQTFVDKLNKIFETPYEEVESKIFQETIMGDSQTEEGRFNFFVR